jgi:hypothetical protein
MGELLRISERRAARDARARRGGLRCAYSGCRRASLRGDTYRCAEHQSWPITSIEMSMSRCAAADLTDPAAIAALCHCEHHLSREVARG